ncbi:MAG: metallophosphoesterase family protein [Candidatus Pacebacteria bacterium]|nr:metallophosphoesterase family protein [Candidatus Paceibacterota bacterium]
MKNYWIISDTHFGHENVKKYCGRPDDFENITFENLKKIPEEDVLIHLGDVAFGNTKEMHEKYIKPIKCKKILILGNHDRKGKQWFLSNGWDEVFKSGELKIVLRGGKMIVFSHIKLLEEETVNYSYNIFGHVHEKEIELTKKQIVYSLEKEGYRPVLLEELINRSCGNISL